MGRRGIHTKAIRGLSDDWLTPPEIIEALGDFDFDPCAYPNQINKTAVKMICLPEDGLSVDWHGRVWLNPPYGNQTKFWMAKIASHGFGTALVPARTEVESWFWPYVWEAAVAVLFIKGRLYFRRPDGSKAGNAGHGSVLAAYSNWDAKLLKESGIAGRYFRLKEKL